MTYQETSLPHRTRPGWRDRMEDKKIDLDILRDAPRLIWYALLVSPGKEFVAQKILRRYGLRTFVPVHNVWRRKNKFVPMKELKSYPVAPRYVFSGFEPGIPLWFELFNLPIISGVVGLEAAAPTEIKADRMVKFIQHLGHGVNAPAVQKFMRTHHEFAVGQTVEVLDGPFKDRKVPVVAIRGAKAAIMLELFGVQQEVDIAMDMLQAA